jgi:hypothetical protein
MGKQKECQKEQNKSFISNVLLYDSFDLGLNFSAVLEKLSKSYQPHYLEHFEHFLHFGDSQHAVNLDGGSLLCLIFNITLSELYQVEGNGGHQVDQEPREEIAQRNLLSLVDHLVLRVVKGCPEVDHDVRKEQDRDDIVEHFEEGPVLLVEG